MGASSSAINPTQDFLARMGGGRVFDMGASTVKYGNSSSELDVAKNGGCGLDAKDVTTALCTISEGE